MAQTVPPPDPEAPRPLPHRSRPPAPRANRPRFLPGDGAWMLLLILMSLAASSLVQGYASGHAVGTAAAAGTVALLYLLGWRARDRAAGVSAGLLAATSLPFLQTAAQFPQSALFTLLTIAALFAFVAGSSLAALGLAACATFVRPDGLLLGLLLLSLALAQQRRRAVYGAAIFLVPLLTAWSAQIALGHARMTLPEVGFSAEPWLWLGTPATMLLLWFLLPFCSEMSEPMRRARWLPVVLCALLALAADTLLLFVTNPLSMRLPLTALLFALAGGGLSRLLPTLGGEFFSPVLRYTLAILAVLSLVALHFRLETRIFG